MGSFYRYTVPKFDTYIFGMDKLFGVSNMVFKIKIFNDQNIYEQVYEQVSLLNGRWH